MSKGMICPHCGEELRFATTDVVWYCRKHGFLSGNEKLWQALLIAKQDLINARLTLEEIDALLLSRKFDITELERLNTIQHLVSRAVRITDKT